MENNKFTEKALKYSLNPESFTIINKDHNLMDLLPNNGSNIVDCTHFSETDEASLSTSDDSAENQSNRTTKTMDVLKKPMIHQENEYSLDTYSIIRMLCIRVVLIGVFVIMFLNISAITDRVYASVLHLKVEVLFLALVLLFLLKIIKTENFSILETSHSESRLILEKNTSFNHKNCSFDVATEIKNGYNFAEGNSYLSSKLNKSQKSIQRKEYTKPKCLVVNMNRTKNKADLVQCLKSKILGFMQNTVTNAFRFYVIAKMALFNHFLILFHPLLSVFRYIVTKRFLFFSALYLTLLPAIRLALCNENSETAFFLFTLCQVLYCIDSVKTSILDTQKYSTLKTFNREDPISLEEGMQIPFIKKTVISRKDLNGGCHRNCFYYDSRMKLFEDADSPSGNKECLSWKQKLLQKPYNILLRITSVNSIRFIYNLFSRSMPVLFKKDKFDQYDQILKNSIDTSSDNNENLKEEILVYKIINNKKNKITSQVLALVSFFILFSRLKRLSEMVVLQIIGYILYISIPELLESFDIHRQKFLFSFTILSLFAIMYCIDSCFFCTFMYVFFSISVFLNKTAVLLEAKICDY